MSAVDDTARAQIKELTERVKALEVAPRPSRFTPKESAMIERIAKIRAQRDAAVFALEEIRDTETHAGKVCGTCHSRIDLASQLISIARGALMALRHVDLTARHTIDDFAVARKLDRESNPDRELELAAGEPSGRLPGDAADLDNAVGTGGGGDSSEVPPEQPEGASSEAPSGQSIQYECLASGCGNPASEDGYCLDHVPV